MLNRVPVQGRDLSTLAPLRVHRARTPDCARARTVVGEGVMGTHLFRPSFNCIAAS